MGSPFSWVGDATVRENLNHLSQQLLHNQHLEVKNGQIEIVDRNSIFSKIRYFFKQDSINEKVKSELNQTIVKLSTDTELANNSDAVQQLFFNQLSHYSEAIFDRSVLGQAKNLANILNPELPKKVDRLERRVEKVRLGQQLGVGLKPIGQGASGSYFVKDYKMKTVGVFKPGSEESTGENTPKLAFKIYNNLRSLVGAQDSGFWPASGYKSEVMSSALADHMKFQTLPRSIIIELQSDQFVSGGKEVGSFQIFEKETKSAQERYNLKGGPLLPYSISRAGQKMASEITRADFEEMVLVDGLILNKDRHYENWLVKNDAEGTSHRIVLIDHQEGFPIVNPSQSDSTYRKHQNKWVKMPQATRPFSQEAKDKIEERLRGKNLQKLLDSLESASEGSFNTKDGNASQAFAFKQRVAVLLLAERTPGFTFREYGNIKSLDEMIEFTKYTIDITNPTDLDKYLGL